MTDKIQPLSPAEVIAQLRSLADSPDFVSGVLFSAPKGGRTAEAERVVRLLQLAAQIIAEPQRFRLLTADERYAIKRLLELLPADELVTTLQVRIDDVAVSDCHTEGEKAMTLADRVREFADKISGLCNCEPDQGQSSCLYCQRHELLEEAIAELDRLTQERERLLAIVENMRFDLPAAGLDGAIAHGYDAAIAEVLALLRAPKGER